MNPNSSTRSPLKAFGILLLLALLGMAGAYFYAWNQGRATLAAQQMNLQSQIQKAQDETQKSRDEVAAINNRLRLLDAQNGLYRAAIALDKRNFGIANTALQGAFSALGRVEASPDFPGARVKALATALGKLDVNVAANLEDQRERILGFAAQLEDLTARQARPDAVEETPSKASPDGAIADSPALDGLTQSENQNAVSSEDAASNSATQNAAS